ncbi:hypothetical protein [Amycolatopsis taiwanensis]|nr:hypothetical protein [Amycolatopsis taiwanensis]
MAIAALVLGIVALCGSPIPILNNATIIAGAVGVVFAIIGLFGAHKVMSSFGLALAVAGIAIGLALQAYWGRQLDDLQTKVNNDLNSIQSSINNAPAPIPTT